METLKNVLTWIITILKNIGIFFIYHPWLGAIITIIIIILISAIINHCKNR